MGGVCLEGGTVLTPLRAMRRGDLLTRGQLIEAVGAEARHRAGCRRVDVRGLFVAPGFIDIHVHGGGGHDVMEGDEDALREISAVHARGGTTAWLGTTLTAPLADIDRALRALENATHWKTGDLRGARVLGAHVEGPYFHPEQAGAQNPAHLRPPDVEEFAALTGSYPSVRRVSLAPELPGALALGAYLAEKGILTSIGHSNACYQEVVKAVEAGFSHVTHIFSGMSTVRRVDAYRVSGVLESALVLDELTTEIIADGHHLPPSLMRLVLKVKGVDNVCAITDAVAPTGLGPGTYRLGGLEIIAESAVPEGYEVEVQDGVAVAKLKDRTAFAGSVASMNAVVRNLVQMVGVSLGEAVKMATTVPARVLGLGQERGMLAPGRVADVVVFDKDLDIKLTMVEGRVVYEG